MNPIGFSKRLPLRHATWLLLIGIGVSLAVGLAASKGRTQALDNYFLDAFLRHSASDHPAHETVVVDIDDVSLSAIGQWPWPRYRVASLIEHVAAAKPAAIGLDVLLPEADRSSLASIRQTMKQDFGVDVAFSGVPAGLQDNDGYLAGSIAQARVVGANYFYFDHFNKTDVPFDPGLTFEGRTDLLRLPVASGVLVNTQSIAAQTRTTGFVNTWLDDDGLLRKVPMLIDRGGVVYASLSLATVMQAMGLAKASIDSDADGLSIRVGGHRVPIDERGTATLRFDGRAQTYAAISAVDLLGGRAAASDIRGKVVFIGSSAIGLNDLHSTALDTRVPGLKVQAAIAENIIQDSFIEIPAWGGAARFAACVVAGSVMVAMFVAPGSVYLAVTGSLLLAVALVTLSAIGWMRDGLFVSPAAPLVVVAALFVLFFVARFAFEKKRAAAWHRQLENARQLTMESMASVAETRDPETGAHIKRTQHYVKAIAQQLRRKGHYTDILTRDYIDLLFLSAPLHDIGKVGVPDHILLKPGKLTADEFEQMKRHAEFGRQILFNAAQHIDGDNFLSIAGEIAATHHEKWDGTGYPLGLAGQAIPLAGRIMAAADIYDALISRRCYKDAFTHEYAMTFMAAHGGIVFDPLVLEAFFAIEGTIRGIAARFGDDAVEAVDGPKFETVAPDHERLRPLTPAV